MITIRDFIELVNPHSEKEKGYTIWLLFPNEYGDDVLKCQANPKCLNDSILNRKIKEVEAVKRDTFRLFLEGSEDLSINLSEWEGSQVILK